MKRLLLSLLIVLPMLANARTEHMKFMGIPIDGTSAQFGQMLVQQKNMTRIDDNFYKGTFFDVKDCYVVVGSNRDVVCGADVRFPKANDWQGLSSRYNKLKEGLTKKYGEPLDAEEFFDEADKYDTDDSCRYVGVEANKCHYLTVWSTPVGQVQLKIENFKIEESYEPQIRLTYFDKLNYDETDAIKYEDL